MTDRRCEACNHRIKEPLVSTDVPVVCIECYHEADDEGGFAGSDLPRSPGRICPDLYAVGRIEEGES